MPVITTSLRLKTQGHADVLDITERIGECVLQSGFHNGIVTVFCPSSTSAVTTIEYESGCVSDLKRLFDDLLPEDRNYQHNSRWGDGNGHSHIRAALLGASLTVPFVSARLTLGTWQQVVYVDFDVRPRQRDLVVQMIGE
jgi:secondary thiamine-phosphate synthase enzyme